MNARLKSNWENWEMRKILAVLYEVKFDNRLIANTQNMYCQLIQCLSCEV